MNPAYAAMRDVLVRLRRKYNLSRERFADKIHMDADLYAQVEDGIANNGIAYLAAAKFVSARAEGAFVTAKSEDVLRAISWMSHHEASR